MYRIIPFIGALCFLCSVAVAAENPPDAYAAIATELFQSMKKNETVAIQPLSEEETKIPAAILRSIEVGLTSSLQRASDFEVKLIARDRLQAIWKEARVKFITSQDKLTARNLYQGFFDFDPSHKTFLTTSHKPIIRGTDIGIWRRIHLLPFTVAIPPEKVEKDFRERRLMPELSGILNYALAGLAAYRKEGLNPPKTVLGSTKEYREDRSMSRSWM